MDTDNIGQTAGNRIFLLGETNLDLIRVKERLSEIARYVDGWTGEGLSEGLVRRKNPFCGDFGRVSLTDVCTDAVIRLIMESHKGYPSEYLYYFLNPAEMGRQETSYIKKLPVVTKILDEWFDEFYGGSGKVARAGNIPDPTPSRIWSDPTQSEFFWFQHAGSIYGDWEVLYNTTKPETHFLFKGRSYYGSAFAELRKRHEERNLFAEGPVSFVKPLGGKIYYLPILGVTKISEIISVRYDMTIQTDLTVNGIEAREVEVDQEQKHCLLPEEYWIRSN